MRKTWFGVVLLACVRAASTGAADSMPQSGFEEHPCNLSVSAEVRSRLRCGSVTVPRDPAAPAAGTFRLAVTIVRSVRQPSKPDPVVLLSGGPGSTDLPVAPVLAARTDIPLFIERDVILVDPRGTGSSEPAACGGIRILEYSAPDQSTVETNRQAAAQMQACIAKAKQIGLRPEWFGTTVIADDMDRVRRALGVANWNAVGTSYGAVTGAALAAKYPSTLRTLILDSVIRTRDGARLDLNERFIRSKAQLFEACAKDLECNGRYPDLQAKYATARAALDKEPLILPLDAASGVASNRYVLNSGDFDLLLFTQLYQEATRVPATIEDVRSRRVQALAPRVMQSAAVGSSISLLGFTAVLCRDDPPVPGRRGAFFVAASSPPAGFHALAPSGMCAGWAAGPAPPEPARTGVPTLVLAGALDPIAPPEQSRRAADAFGGTYVEFAGTGHGVLPQNPCAQAIATQFVSNPKQALDLACSRLPAPMRFE